MSAIIPPLAEMGIAPPPATATVPVDMLPIVDPSHCVPQEVTLLINEKTKSYSGDTFTVIDCKDGKMKYW
jgi:UTP-glucose-1-phosphate uridylyltransferase